MSLESPALFFSRDKGSSKQQHRDSNWWPAEEGNLLHHLRCRTKHIQTLRKRIRNKTSLPRWNILATRSMYFRVQFHRKLRLSLQRPSRPHDCVPAGITRSLVWFRLAAPDPPGTGTSTRAFPRWGIDLFVPPLLTQLVGSCFSLKYYPCVTTGSYSLYVRQLLSQIRSGHAGKHYHPICSIFLSETSVLLHQ